MERPRHRANKGRVLVDSTWHHWFNVNLFGLRAENGDEYKDVLAFFRNVAVWLSPKNQQAVMRRAGSLVFMFSPAMIEHTLTLREIRPDRLYALGVYARDALGRVAPQCQSAAWFIHWVEKLMPAPMIKAAAARGFNEQVDLFEAAAMDVMAATIFGGVVNALAVAINERGFEKLEALHDEFDGIADRGGKLGMEVALKELAQAQRQIKALVG